MKETSRLNKPAYYFVNALTITRSALALGAANYYIATRDPVIPSLIFTANLPLDVLDGYLARKYKVSSEEGARLDGFSDALNMTLGVGINVFERVPNTVAAIGITALSFVGLLYFFQMAQKDKVTMKSFSKSA